MSIFDDENHSQPSCSLSISFISVVCRFLNFHELEFVSLSIFESISLDIFVFVPTVDSEYNIKTNITTTEKGE